VFQALIWSQELLLQLGNSKDPNYVRQTGASLKTASPLLAHLSDDAQWQLFPVLCATQCFFAYLQERAPVGSGAWSPIVSDAFISAIQAFTKSMRSSGAAVRSFSHIAAEGNPEGTEVGRSPTPEDSFDASAFLQSSFHPSVQHLITLSLVLQQRASTTNSERVIRWPVCIQRLIGRRDLIETASAVRANTAGPLAQQYAAEQTKGRQRTGFRLNLQLERDFDAPMQEASTKKSITDVSSAPNRAIVNDHDGLAETEKLGLAIFAEDDRIHEVCRECHYSIEIDCVPCPFIGL
jgi:hypothetical protein